MVAVEGESGCSALDHLKLSRQVLLMGVPDRAAVFKVGADKGIIGLFFNRGVGVVEVAPQKAEDAVSTVGDCVNVGFPAKPVVNGDS